MQTDSRPSDPRAEEALAWALAELSLASQPGVTFAPASADASFRRYFRLTHAGQSWILMDAPPAQEDSGPFVRVAGLMLEAGLNVPKVLAQDLERGFLLLTDLGCQTYLDVLNADNAPHLMGDAIEALVIWQCASQPGVLPPYDEVLLARELDLFVDWYVARHLQRTLGEVELRLWRQVRQSLIASAVAQARVYVHRDYMPRNLMPAAPNPGILDFQDAVEGPITYDVICLFRDAFLSWPEPQVEQWLRQYWQLAGRRGLSVRDDFDAFRRDADWMGLQRHLKVIGIFARICYRDGKPRYLSDVPRFITYVRTVASRYPEMSALLQLFDALGIEAPA